MKLHILGSESTGNGYLLHAKNGASLLIEAGIPLKQVALKLGMDMMMLKGVFITHEHGDHAKYIYDYTNAGIDIYASRGTMQELKARYPKIERHSYLLHTIKQGAVTQRDLFSVIAFDLVHDAAEPTGFLIKHPEMGVCLFVSDSHYLNKRFRGLTQMIVEANYCEDLIEQKLQNETIHPALAKRIKSSHMSVQTALRFISSQDTTAVANIVLCHLSASNSKAEEFAKKVREATGRRVTIADKKMTVDFNEIPF